MKPIVTTPHEILILEAAKVGKVDARIKKIIAEMKKTLIGADNPKGVGLAAPQIGVSLRIFLLRPEESDPIRVFINPEYLEKSKMIVKGIEGNKLEGCLSVPHVWGQVQRHKSIKISFLDEKGSLHEETFRGFPAIIVQHEMDHLHGVLFTRKVIEQKGTLYKPGVDENGKEILEPIDL